MAENIEPISRVIDLHKKETEQEVEKLCEKRESMRQIGHNLQELPSLPVGNRVLYEKNPDSSKIKRPEWVKGTVKEKFGKRKYQILTDSDKVVTRSRHHIKDYQTCSGRISKIPDHFNAK